MEISYQLVINNMIIKLKMDLLIYYRVLNIVLYFFSKFIDFIYLFCYNTKRLIFRKCDYDESKKYKKLFHNCSH